MSRKNKEARKKKSFSNDSKSRKAAPKKKKKNIDKVDKKLTGAINRNIEALMAARCIHEGKRLKVVERPRDVQSLLKQKGAAKSKKAAFDVIKTGLNQKRRRKNEIGEEMKNEIKKLKAADEE